MTANRCVEENSIKTVSLSCICATGNIYTEFLFDYVRPTLLQCYIKIHVRQFMENESKSRIVSRVSDISRNFHQMKKYCSASTSYHPKKASWKTNEFTGLKEMHTCYNQSLSNTCVMDALLNNTCL